MLGLGNILTKGGAILGFPNKYSFNFDGSNDYLEIENNSALEPSAEVTVSAWAYMDNWSGASDSRIISNTESGGYALTIDVSNDNNITFYVNNGTWLTPDYALSNLSSGWHHVCGTYKNKTAKLYIDGSLVDTDTNTNNTNITYGSNINFFVGGEPDGSNNVTKFFNGKVDEVSVFDAELSASDVAKIGSKPVDFSKASTYATDRTSNLKLWLRAGDKALPEEDASIARQDFYTDFDGTDDYVDCGAGVGNELGDDYSGDLTVSAWIKPLSTSGDKGFLNIGDFSSSYGEFVFHLYQNKLYLTLNSNGWRTFTAFTNTDWSHVTAVYKAGSESDTKIYVNGESQSLTGSGTFPSASDMDFNGLKTIIGAYHSTTYAYDGKISNLSIHQTALDAQTIKQFAKSRFTPMRDNRFSVVDFDGSDDYISTNADSTLADATYTFWARSTQTGENNGVFGHGDEDIGAFHFNRQGTGKPLLFLGTNRYKRFVDNSAQDDGQWHHFAVILDSDDITGCKFYIDGVEQSSDASANSGDFNAYTSGIEIGRANSSQEWEGSMAQFAVYSDLKDSDFIYAQWSKGITADFSSDANLSAYYRMGDDTSKEFPTIADSSSNSNDGTITNGASDDVVQQMVAGYDLGAFESIEEVNGELNPNPTFSNFTGNVPDGWSVVGDDDSGNNISQGSAGGLRLQSDGGSIFAHLADVNVVGKTYHFSVTITNVNIDDFSLKTLNTKFFNGDGKSAGTYTGTYVAEATYVRIFRDASCDVEITALSIKEEIQSADLSDTHPAIIDVNEPVLGAETVDNNIASAWTPYSDNQVANVTDGVKITYATSGSGSGSGAKAMFTDEGLLNFTINVSDAKLYKLTFNAYYEGGSSGVFARVYDSSVDHATPALTTTETTYTLYFKGIHATAIQLYFANLASGNVVYITNMSFKEVQGNVGTMTNQATSDLVYSSVLPDQSFLTGLNSAYNFLDFDGSDAFVNCGGDIDVVGAFTISAWVNPDNFSYQLRSIASQGNSFFGFSDHAERRLMFQGQGSGANNLKSNTDLAHSTWHHIVLTVSGTNAGDGAIYVNGSRDDDGDSTVFLTAGDFVIGKMPNASSRYMNGKITQVAIYNKVLTSTEVSGIYNLGRHGNLLDSYSDNLKGYWVMGGLDSKTGFADTDSTIYDRSGNSNHGTTSGTATGDLKSPPNAEPNGYAKGDTNRSTTTP